ncbi:HlyD family efflux transporter periplasmic adaptor subunit [Butyrivibrio sp. MC2013]|uniref:HlyD family efflux transporter periplasmic adaptor subunit n=1 Tax=Butyrivibrio sp. MC2013 TaxID=1280686 RepID=UPI0004129779|nr:HlyD family efflux transporter periplasmic adaptor subunit [Butyrivibrio sp. MC2013]
MAAGSKSNIRKFNNRGGLGGLTIIFFAGLLIYVIISIVNYYSKKHITGYEVTTGSLSQNNTYRAITLRKERVVNSSSSGPVYYFAMEDRHVAKGDLVCITDESDTLADSRGLNDSSTSVLTDIDYSKLRNEISSFQSSFDERSFLSVYDFSSSIRGSVSKLVNSSYLNSISDIGSQSGAFKYQFAPESGTVIYSIDGFENLTLEQMKPEYFDEEEYTPEYFTSRDIITTGSPCYKLSTDEDWQIVIQVADEKTAKELEKEEYIEVRFLKNQATAWGQVARYTDNEGNCFVSLSFTNSMINFASDRFLYVELITDAVKGLKIPSSAILDKDFYTIDSSYIYKNDQGKYGVDRKTILEDGSVSTEFIATNIYAKLHEKDEDGNETGFDTYYIDTDSLSAGDVIIAPDSKEEFSVGMTSSLHGVYNINKGYADFCVIDIMESNESYAIVQSNTSYGLREHDYIVLDAETVINNEIIYK